MKNRIENLRRKIQERFEALQKNPQGLPESCPGDTTKPSLSRDGHRRLINEDENNLRSLEEEYESLCRDPPSGGAPATVPIPENEPLIDLETAVVVVTAAIVVAAVVYGTGGSAALETLRQVLAGEDADVEYYRRYTGQGRAFELRCNSCHKEGDRDPLHAICAPCTRAIEDEGRLFGELGIVGAPELMERPGSLRLRHGPRIPLRWEWPEVLALAPLPGPEGAWLALITSGYLLRIDLSLSQVATLCRLDPGPFSLAGHSPLAQRLDHIHDVRGLIRSPHRKDELTLAASPDGRFALITQRRGLRGGVIDLTTRGAVTLRLFRGTYHTDVSDFAATFCRLDGRLLLVAATDWNWLDVFDPATGKLCTTGTAPSAGSIAGRSRSGASGTTTTGCCPGCASSTSSRAASKAGSMAPTGR
jgi:hypothetical protein